MIRYLEENWNKLFYGISTMDQNYMSASLYNENIFLL